MSILGAVTAAFASSAESCFLLTITAYMILAGTLHTYFASALVLTYGEAFPACPGFAVDL